MQPGKSSHADIPISELEAIDRVCQAFERECKQIQRPSIRRYLKAHQGGEHEYLLCELLKVDLHYRQLWQSSPLVHEYIEQLPDYEPVIRQVFSDAGIADMTLQATDLNKKDTRTGSTDTEDTFTLPPDSASATPQPGDCVRYFGDYELLEEIARGGMGVVYKARQVSLNRPVALKMILSGQLAGEEEVKRFYAEAEAAANLDHPNIVPVFEVGQHKEQHYYSMGLIEGPSLAARLAAGPLPPTEAAQIVRVVSEAVAYAHRRGVIHRDLKPGNILLANEPSDNAAGSGRRISSKTKKLGSTSGELHEAPASPGFTPKVTDFGLAKKLADEEGITATGQILGTPAYMPPEQASGRVQAIAETSDVYSLGAILYCLLVGRPPFQAASALETVLQVLETEPVAPRLINAAIPSDLETIVLKCLEKSPEKRYASAQDLIDELQRFLSGKPILARPIGRMMRAYRWSRRNPLGAAVVALAIALTVIGVSSAFGFRNMFKREQALRKQTDVQYVSHLFNLAIRRAEEEPILGIVPLAEALKVAEEKQTPELEKAIRLQLKAWMRGYSPPDAVLRQNHPISFFSFAPDSKTIVTCSSALRRFACTGELIWERSGGTSMQRGDSEIGYVTSLEHSPDGKRLLVAHFTMPDSTPQGDPMATVVELRDTQSGERDVVVAECEAILDGRSNRGLVRAKFSPDGKFVVYHGGITGVHVWDYEQRKLTQHLLEKDVAQLVEFSPDGNSLVVHHEAPAVSRSHPPRRYQVKVWNTRSWQPEEAPWANLPESTSIKFSGTEPFVCVMTAQEIRVYDMRKEEWSRASFKVSQMSKASVHFFPGPTLLITDIDRSTGKRKSVVWNPHTGRQIGVPFHRAVGNKRGLLPVTSSSPEFPLARSNDRQVIAKSKRYSDRGGDWRILRLCDGLTGTPIGRSFLLYDESRSKAAFSPDGKILAVQEICPKSEAEPDPPEYALTLWKCNAALAQDWRTPEVRTRLRTNSPSTLRLLEAFEDVRKLRSGTRLAVAADGSVISVRADFEGVHVAMNGTERQFKSIPVRSPFLHAAELTRDKTALAIAGRNGMPIYVCKVEDGSIANELECGKDWISSLAFDGQAKLLAAGSFQSAARVRVWSLKEGRLLHSWPTSRSVMAVDCSEDGNLVAGGTENSRVQVWSVRNGKMLWSRKHRPGQPIVSIQFSPDGKFLASAASDTSIQLFDAATGEKVGPPLKSAAPFVPLLMDHCIVRFSDDGKSVAWIGLDGSFAEWVIPQPISGTGSELLKRARAATSLRFDSIGAVRRLTSDEMSSD